MGGPPTPQVFWFNPCKTIDHVSKDIFCCVFLIVFLQTPRNLYMFGHKVGSKHRFLQYLTVLFQSFLQKQHNLHVLQCKVGPKHWFLQCVQYSNIPNPLKTSVFAFYFCIFVRFSVAGSLPSPFFRCQKPPKATQNAISIPS